MNMENKIKEELDRMRAALWASFRFLKDVTDQLTEPKLMVCFLDSTVLPTLCYSAETWAVSSSPRSLHTSNTALELCPLKFTDHSSLVGVCSSDIGNLCHCQDYLITLSRTRYIKSEAQMARSRNKNRQLADEKNSSVDFEEM